MHHKVTLDQHVSMLRLLTRRRLFWTFCGGWSAILVSVAILRNAAVAPGPVVSASIAMPRLGSTVHLPAVLRDLDGTKLPSLDSARATLFLFLKVRCPACQRDVVDLYPDILQSARGHRLLARVLIEPSQADSTEWFAEHLRNTGAALVVDSMGIARDMGFTFAPAAMLIAPDGSLTATYWPGHDWPVDPPSTAQDSFHPSTHSEVTCPVRGSCVGSVE